MANDKTKREAGPSNLSEPQTTPAGQSPTPGSSVPSSHTLRPSKVGSSRANMADAPAQSPPVRPSSSSSPPSDSTPIQNWVSQQSPESAQDRQARIQRTVQLAEGLSGSSGGSNNSGPSYPTELDL